MQGHKPNFLQHHVAVRISQYFFLDPVIALHFRVGKFVERDSGLGDAV